MTRVTPQQFSVLSFVSTDRYEPVRPLGETLKAKKSAPFACGNIVVLNDKRPNSPQAEGKYLEMNPSLWVADPETPSPEAAAAQTPGPAPAQGQGQGHGGARTPVPSNEPIADAPAPFEYPFE